MTVVSVSAVSEFLSHSFSMKTYRAV